MNAKQTVNKLSAFVIAGAMLIPLAAVADGSAGHMHGHGNTMNDEGYMMSQEQMGEHMREVEGDGRINKIMNDRHMLNISHEPMPELNWPKMRMNFKADQSVKLDGLNPGDQVTFTLQVDSDNNYLIKKIEKK